MDVPDWLKPILQQFPIVTLSVGAMMLGVWWLNKRHREELLRLQANSDGVQQRTNAEIERMRLAAIEQNNRANAELDRMRAADTELRKNHLAELNRMAELFQSQLAKLQERIRELETKGRKS